MQRQCDVCANVTARYRGRNEVYYRNKTKYYCRLLYYPTDGRKRLRLGGRTKDHGRNTYIHSPVRSTSKRPMGCPGRTYFVRLVWSSAGLGPQIAVHNIIAHCCANVTREWLGRWTPPAPSGIYNYYKFVYEMGIYFFSRVKAAAAAPGVINCTRLLCIIAQWDVGGIKHIMCANRNFCRFRRETMW